MQFGTCMYVQTIPSPPAALTCSQSFVLRPILRLSITFYHYALVTVRNYFRNHILKVSGGYKVNSDTLHNYKVFGY